MNLTLREWNIIIEALRIAAVEFHSREYDTVADKIQYEKFTNNMSSFNPD